MENKKQLVLDQIQQVLLDNNGQLLSDYKNAAQKLTWKCKEGHIFYKSWVNVRRGQWCYECGWYNPTIHKIQEFAKSRNGECLSTIYVRSIDKLIWKCQNNHIWDASLNSVKNSKSWCPYCYMSVGENITRKYFEFIFQKPFIKIRPFWLLNNSGHRLELDGYCAQLNLAFEYNSQQHYGKKIYAENNAILLDNDLHKIQICKKKNIKLFIIPECKNYVDKKIYIKEYIIKYLPKFGFKIPNTFIDFELTDKLIYDNDIINELRHIATDRDGYLISDHYLGDSNKLIWKCKYKHIWEAMPGSIKRGSWCPHCANKSFSLFSLLEILNEMKEMEKNLIYRKAIIEAIKLLNNISTYTKPQLGAIIREIDNDRNK